MKRVYLVTVNQDERRALRLLLADLNLMVAGEAADWTTVMVQAPAAQVDMVVVDWEVLAAEASANLTELRTACAKSVKIILLSRLDARDQAALSSGADTFISKGETSERIIERLQAVVESLPS